MIGAAFLLLYVICIQHNRLKLLPPCLSTVKPADRQIEQDIELLVFYFTRGVYP